MTIAVWPDDLPQQVLVDGFQAGPAGSRLKTAMDSGPGKQRPRGPKVSPRSCSIYADSNQIARFERFWSEEVGLGTQPFLMRSPLTDGRAVADELGLVLLDEEGRPLLIEDWTLVQFGQNEPAYSAIGGLDYRITFDLVVLP